MTGTVMLNAPAPSAVAVAAGRGRVRVGVGGRDVDPVAGRRRAGDGDRRCADRALVGRARHRQRGRRPGCARRSAGTCSGGRSSRLARARCRRTAGRTAPADQSSGSAEPAGCAVHEADRGHRRVACRTAKPRGRELPVLLGDQADTAGELVHAVEQRRRAGRIRRSGASARRARPTAPARRGRCPARSAPTDGRRWSGRRSRRRCSGASPARWRCRTRSSRPRPAATRGCPDRSAAARRAGPARGSPASITVRWSSVGPPLPTL